MSGLQQRRSKPSEGLTDPFRVLSTSSGAACWTWPHPLPHNPTRDDLASTRTTLLDLTTTQLSATRGLSITLMWLHSMTEWIMWQSCLCTWNMVIKKRGSGTLAAKWHTVNIPAHNYISLSCAWNSQTNRGFRWTLKYTFGFFIF